MRRSSLREMFAGSLLVALALLAGRASADAISFKKTVIEPKFRAEGVAVADVNKDGKNDILVGDVWYEAPSWKIHEIRKPGEFGDGAGGYSQSFACWADDVNADGWADLIVVGFPGAPCHWYENPQNKEGHWKQYQITDNACNETPLYTDLLGRGRRHLILGGEAKGTMRYFGPGKDPTQPWEERVISDPATKAPGTNKFAHGLGVGDVSGDGKLDVLVTAGWWEQPAKDDGQAPWTFHKVGLGEACADMYAYDIDANGKADVISSSAHNYGIWAHMQTEKDGKRTFTKTDLFPKLFSQSHAMHCVDINGDGLKDLVTGKRKWAHGPKGDADPSAPPVLVWFEAQKSAEGAVKFVPNQIDDASGIGTQFWVGDFNGDAFPDIAVANKAGVFLFEQVREKK